MRKKILTLTVIGAFLGLFVSFIGIKTASAAVSNWQKGASIEPRWDTDFSSQTFQQSLKNLAAAKANYVALIIPYYQSNLYSTDIQKGWNTPTDDSLVAAIKYAHSLGLKVMVKPHLQSYTGEWRANIRPSDRQTWFANYNSMLAHYATIAQQNGAESYCVGAELASMAGADQNYDNTQQWRNMISNVRKLYSGKLTYSANWGPPNNGMVDEKNNIQFWDALDFIGISAYYDMFTDNSAQSLTNAWNNYNMSDIQPLAQKWNKPIMFTEIGYKSVPNSFNHPWDYNMGGGFDETTQANAYEALFSYWNSQSFINGVMLWDWSSDPNAGGQGDTGYTPQNKKAQQIMTNWFSEGESSAHLTSTIVCPGPATNAFTGCYYADKNFTNLVMTRIDPTMNFDWGTGSPDPKMPSDNFSAVWQGNFSFNAGNYTFTATADDGVRVFVDGIPVIDKFIDQPPTTYTGTITLAAGTHLVKMEYYEHTGGAVAKLSWAQNGSINPSQGSCPTASNNSFTGCYYSGRNFDNFILSRNDPSINFDWGAGSPDPKVPSDNFSAVWQGNFQFSADNYNFAATADDGIRVLVDGTPVIDKFFDQPATTYNATKNLTAGTHLVKIEYYEHTVNAVAKVSWSRQGGGTTLQVNPPANKTVSIWWPTFGSHVSGAQPFKAVLSDTDLNAYNMYWQVDGDQLNQMGDSQQDAPHKEAWVDLASWNWNSSGPYHLNFLAKDFSGNLLGQTPIDIYIP